MKPNPFLTPAHLAACADTLECGASLAVAAQTLPLAATDEAARAESRLTAAEQHRLSAFRFIKRRQEWLAGRVAAKEAACLLLSPPPSPTELEIAATPAGRPFLTHPRTGDLPEISISHTRGLAVAAATFAAPCGIDVQAYADNIIRIQQRFCLQGEKEKIMDKASCAEITALTLLWAAKEAVRKAYAVDPMAGFLEIRLDGVEQISHNSWRAICSIDRLDIQGQKIFLLQNEAAAAALTLARRG